MSSKIERILELSELKNKTEFERQVLSALIGCLDALETSEFLLHTMEGKIELRDLALQKISHDLSSGLSKEHIKLVENLISLGHDSEYRVANSAATCLVRILENSNGDFAKDIVAFFLSSERMSFRNKAWKYLAENSNESYKKIIWKTWEKYGDKRALKAIVTTIDPDILNSNREKIINAIEHDSLVGKLYLRLHEVDEEVVEELFNHSISTYLYCLVKLGLSLPEYRKSEITLHADPLGLVLWCLGRLGEWEIVERMYADAVQNNM